MVHVETQIDIDLPFEVVFAFVSDPENAPSWYVNIHSVEWRTEKPLQIGSQLAFQAKFLGRRLAYVYEVVHLDREKMVMRTSNGPFPMQTEYHWKELGPNQTRLILKNSGKPSGFSSLLAPLMEKSMQRANEKDLKLLKHILESEKVK